MARLLAGWNFHFWDYERHRISLSTADQIGQQIDHRSKFQFNGHAVITAEKDHGLRAYVVDAWENYIEAALGSVVANAPKLNTSLRENHDGEDYFETRRELELASMIVAVPVSILFRLGQEECRGKSTIVLRHGQK